MVLKGFQRVSDARQIKSKLGCTLDYTAQLFDRMEFAISAGDVISDFQWTYLCNPFVVL